MTTCAARTSGINSLVVLGDLLLIDNVGRNFEIRRRTGDAHEPAVAQVGRCDVTILPGEDVPSNLDLDVHGAALTGNGSWLLVDNHYGHVPCFARPLAHVHAGFRPTPAFELQLLGDTERVLLYDDCLVVSSPRGAYIADPPRPVIFISEHVAPPRASAPEPAPR